MGSVENWVVGKVLDGIVILLVVLEWSYEPLVEGRKVLIFVRYRGTGPESAGHSTSSSLRLTTAVYSAP